MPKIATPQTAEDIAELAQTWISQPSRRSYARYARLGKAIRLLAQAGWNSRAITDRIVQNGLHPEDQAANLYHHITRLRRAEGI